MPRAQADIVSRSDSVSTATGLLKIDVITVACRKVQIPGAPSYLVIQKSGSHIGYDL